FAERSGFGRARCGRRRFVSGAGAGRHDAKYLLRECRGSEQLGQMGELLLRNAYRRVVANHKLLARLGSPPHFRGASREDTSQTMLERAVSSSGTAKAGPEPSKKWHPKLAA